MPTVESALAKTLKGLREKKGYSQSDVGAVLNQPQAVISYWENNRRGISPTNLCSLAAVYETTPSKIYECIDSEVSDVVAQRAKKLEQKINIERELYGNRNKN